MAKNHNFKTIPSSERFDAKSGKKVYRLHCKDCDSIVQYPVRYTEHEVNHAVMNSRLACLPPVDNADRMAKSEYYDKKYDKLKIN